MSYKNEITLIKCLAIFQIILIVSKLFNVLKISWTLILIPTILVLATASMLIIAFAILIIFGCILKRKLRR